MAAQKGREMLVKVSDGGSPDVFSTVGGIRTRSFAVNNEQVDITDSDNAPWRQLLGDAGLRSISVSGSGVFKDEAAINTVEELAFSGNNRDFQLVFGNSDYIQGSFQVAGFTYEGEHDGEQTYTLSLESAGVCALSRA